MTVVTLALLSALPSEAGTIGIESRSGSVTVDKWWFVDPFEPMSISFEIGLVPQGGGGQVVPPSGLGGAPGAAIFQDLFSTAGVYALLDGDDEGPDGTGPMVNQVLLVDDAGAASPIPEPGVTWLLASALAGLIARSRRS